MIWREIVVSLILLLSVSGGIWQWREARRLRRELAAAEEGLAIYSDSLYRMAAQAHGARAVDAAIERAHAREMN